MNYDKVLLCCQSFSAVQEEEGNILLRNVGIYQSTRYDILQDLNLHQHHHENLKPSMNSGYSLAAASYVWNS
jgi:hypothetical protein